MPAHNNVIIKSLSVFLYKTLLLCFIGMLVSLSPLNTTLHAQAENAENNTSAINITEPFTLSKKLYFRPRVTVGYVVDKAVIKLNLNLISKNNHFNPYFLSAIKPKTIEYIIGGGIENNYKNFFSNIFYQAYFPLDNNAGNYNYTYDTGVSIGGQKNGTSFSVGAAYGIEGVTFIKNYGSDELEYEHQIKSAVKTSISLSSLLFYNPFGEIFFNTSAGIKFISAENTANTYVYDIRFSLPNTFAKTKWGYFYSNIYFYTLLQNSSTYFFREGYFKGIPNPEYLSSNGYYIGNVNNYDLLGNYILRGALGYVYFPFANFSLKPLKGLFLAISGNTGWVHDTERKNHAHQMAYSILGTIGYKPAGVSPIGFSFGWNNAYGIIVNFRSLY